MTGTQSVAATAACRLAALRAFATAGLVLLAVVPASPCDGADISEDVVNAVRRHNAWWLAPDPAAFPNLAYTFKLRDESQQLSFQEMPGLHFRRGVSLSLGLDEVLRQPDKFQAQVRFEGTYGGREVVVVGFAGPSIRLIFGNGVSGTWRGYVSTSAPSVTVVFDKAAWRPLVSLCGEVQFHFLDYVQVAPGRHAPLRIVVLREDDGELETWDFRFQVLDGRVWLFDRSYSEGGSVAASLEHAALDGKPPADVRRIEEEAVTKTPQRFSLDLVTNRTRLSEEQQLLSEVLHGNRPWLNPELDHLESVEFVHAMEPQVFEERFAWRRDGTSIVEVVKDMEDKEKSQVGKWCLTTPEPASYTRSPGVRFVKPTPQEKGFYAAHFRDHLMGTRCSFGLLDFGRSPDRFVVAKVEPGEGGVPITIELRPSERHYYVHAGAMFHYTSWAYVHHVRVGRIDVLVDPQTRRPVRERDFSSSGELECELEFLDYQEVGDGQAVPRLIHLQFPKHDFDVRYHFQWHPEKLWILTRGESRFAKSEGPQRQTIRDLRINQPATAFDAAMATLADTRGYLDAQGVQKIRAVAAHPFLLGKRVQVGARRVLFTIHEDGHLIAEVSGPGDQPAAGAPAAILLVGEKGELLAAAQGPPGAALDFGRSQALVNVDAFCIGTPVPKPPVEGAAARSLPAVPLTLDGPVVVDVPDQVEGKTRIKRIRFRQDEEANLTATVEIVSTDHWKVFGVDVCAGLLDARGMLIAGASTTARLQVDGNLKWEEVKLDFGTVDAMEEGSCVAIGVARTRDYGAYHGHGLWFTLMRPQETPFPVERLLAGEDIRCWKAGLKILDREIHEEVLRHGLLDDSWYGYKRALERGQTPAKTLEPHAARLAELLNRRDNPEALSLACRLVGHSGQTQHADKLAPLLEDPRDAVKDAAAIGLGMLGDEAGMEPLVAILTRPEPKLPKAPTREDRAAWEQFQRIRLDAALALGGIGTDESVHALGKALVEAARQDASFAEKLIYILRNTQNPQAVAYLARVLDIGRDVGRAARQALTGFKEHAHEVFAEAIRQGDSRAVDAVSETNDAYYLPLIREMVFRKEIDEWAFYHAADYLWNLGSDRALEVMREIYDADPHPEARDARLRLATALAYRGDDRGFAYAFDLLKELAEPVELPEDERERRDVQRQRDREAEKALDVFTRGRDVRDHIVRFLEPRLQSDDAPTLVAALKVVENLRATPEALQPALEKLATSRHNDVAEMAAKLKRRL